MSFRCGVCVPGCVYVGELMSYADAMVLLAPSVTALQILLGICRAYSDPHDIVYNTTKTVCLLVRPKQSHGRLTTTVKLGNEELSIVD